MAVAHLSRSILTVGAVVTVTASIPLLLTSCSTAQLEAQAAQLHASTESDVLSRPTAMTFDVTEVEVLEPQGPAELRSVLGAGLASSGHFVLNDGMITEAELSVGLANVAEATFVMTEPALLPEDLEDQSGVIVTGVLTVDGVAQQHTKVRLVPVSLTEEAAEFDVSFAMPENPLVSGSESMSDTVSARLLLAAR